MLKLFGVGVRSSRCFQAMGTLSPLYQPDMFAQTQCEVSEWTSCLVSSSAPGQFLSLMVSGKGCRLTFKIRSRGASSLHCCYHRLCADLLHLGPQPLGRRRVFMKLARPWLLATGVFFPALSILTSPSVQTLCMNRQKELTSTEHLLCAWCC